MTMDMDMDMDRLHGDRGAPGHRGAWGWDGAYGEEQASPVTEEFPDPLPRNPNVVVPLAATEPFQAALRTVEFVLTELCTPFQTWVIVWPTGFTQLTVQPFTAAVPAWTVISPWNPPPHALMLR